MTRSFVPAAFALTAALTVAGSAFAAPLTVSRDSDLVTAKVAYADDDLHSAQGAKALAFRIGLAAANVCGGDNPVIRSGQGFAKCRHAAIDRALTVLSSPMVAEAAGRSTSLAQVAPH